MNRITFLLVISLLLLQGCQKGYFRSAPVKDNPTNVNERVERNIKQGKGVSFGNFGKKGSGTFDFASSNLMWRATLETLDFVTFANASYSGGIIITDWFNDNSGNNNSRDLKITIKFLSNEIRADGLQIDIHERICKPKNPTSCTINKIDSVISNELTLAILKKAAYMKNNIYAENEKNYKKKITINKENEKKKKK